MKKLNTTAEVLDALGGNEAAAKLLDSTERTVRSWRYSEQFPAKTYLAITSELAKMRKTADLSLWNFVRTEAAE